MSYTPKKKSLKAGEPQQIMMRFCVDNLNQFCAEYGCTPEEGLKLWIEMQDSYCDLYFNYGYSITFLKVAQIDDLGWGEYRCRALIEKI